MGRSQSGAWQRSGGAVRGDHTIARRPWLDSPSDYLVVALLSAAVVATVGAWTIGQAAGLLFRRSWPPVRLGDGLRIATQMPQHWDDPRQAWPLGARDELPGPVGFLVTTVLMLLLLLVLAALIARRFGNSRQVRGFASHSQIRRALSPQAALDRAAVLRPTLAAKRVRVRDVAVDVGRSGGESVAVPIDASVVLLAAARQGKTSQIIIPWLTDWPGPILTTSVRTDVALNTIALRREIGPVAVMDLTGNRWPYPLRWSPTSGCAAFDVARQRADVMVAVGKADTGPSDSTNAQFFGLTATNLLAGWLHAAALTDRPMGDVLTWALDERLDEPIRLLRDHPRAATGVASMLDNIYRSPAETRSNMWTTVMTAVAPLLSEVAREAFSPPRGHGFDIDAFLRERGTAYLIVPEYQAKDLAPIVSAFVEELTQAAARQAAVAPTGRLDPPLGLLLDEVANVVPLPRLPQLMSYAGGTGIFTTAVLQDIAQARQRWGRDGADMIWGAATVKIALGGLGGDELTEFSRLAGQYRESLTTSQFGSHGFTMQTTLQDRPAISPEHVRMLSEHKREALVLHATTPPVITRMVRHYEGPHAAEHAASFTETRAALIPGFGSAVVPDGPGPSGTSTPGSGR